MRLKEIKPGMVIHCKNIAEYERLEEETIKNGYGELPLHNHSEDFIKKVVFYINYKKTLWGGLNKNYIEFSDLILPEITAEELLNILNEITHCVGRMCDECPLAENGENLCTKDVDAVKISNPDKLISICQQWKSEHEKKEPEIETVDICRIIEIQPDGKKRCVHEEDISDGELMYSGDAVENCRYILKNYCKEHDGEFIAVHEVVSRVKAV